MKSSKTDLHKKYKLVSTQLYISSMKSGALPLKNTCRTFSAPAHDTNIYADMNPEVIIFY